MASTTTTSTAALQRSIGTVPRGRMGSPPLPRQATSCNIPAAVLFCNVPTTLATLPPQQLYNQHHQQQQVRWFQNKTYHKHRRGVKKTDGKKTESPFVVLGFASAEASAQLTARAASTHGVAEQHAAAPQIPYAEIKQAFLRIAMKHHPDTSQAKSEEEREDDKEIFMNSRKAFEAIVEGPNGLAVLRSELNGEAWQDDEEALNDWFRQETGGFDMPFMDAQTMKEVAEMTEEAGDMGLDRDGGMWLLARTVANQVKNGGDGASVLQLEAGAIRDRAIDGVIRRRRRR